MKVLSITRATVGYSDQKSEESKFWTWKVGNKRKNLEQGDIFFPTAKAKERNPGEKNTSIHYLLVVKTSLGLSEKGAMLSEKGLRLFPTLGHGWSAEVL